jgi:DNA-directed RNA polymerase subunit beta'
VLANWDPLTRPIITEYAGTVKFENVEEGVTVAKQIDEVTGLSTLVVIDPKRRGADQGRASAGQAARRAGEEVEDRRHRPLGDDRLPGRRADPRCATARTLAPGEVLARIPQRSARRRATSPAVCRAWPSCSRPARPKDAGMLAEVDRHACRSARTPRASSACVITDPDGKRPRST